MAVLSCFLVGSAVILMGLAAYLFLRPKPPPFHVNYPPVVINAGFLGNIFPFFRFVMTLIPESMRKSLVVKMGAPKPGDKLRDRYDCTGESPYTTKEVVPGRLWQVTYEVIMTLFASEEGKKQARSYGLVPSNPAYVEKALAGAAQYGEEAETTVKKDIQKCLETFAKETFTDEELLQLSVWSLNMLVLKLDGGGILLYNPVRIREETGFAEWIDGLGKVDWIIIASGTHTLNLPSVLERYPEAKVVGPTQAEAKLNYISALPRGKLDFYSTDAEDMANANRSLQAEGLHLHAVAHDVVTNSINAIFRDEHLLTCDLIYTHGDGDGFLSIDRDRFRQFLPEDWFARLYKYHDLARPNSPHGFLPAYRYQLMDPAGSGVLLYKPPETDGSSCRIMARSLRALLRAEFRFVHGVHFEQMTREAFSETIDRSWNWLDGKSLLP